MSEHGFICVGGPLDGQWKAQAPGQLGFNLAISPLQHSECCTPHDGVALRVSISYVSYRLQEHDLHGAAWVLQ